MHSPRRRLVPVALLLAATLALAACGSSSKTPAGAGTTEASGDKVTLRLGYFPNVTHAPAHRRRRGRHLRRRRSARTSSSSSATLNSGTEATTAILADALDAALRRPEPGDQRVPEVERQGHPDRRRDRVGRRVPRREARHHERRRPQGQEDRDAAARQHAGRRAAHLAEEARASTTDTEGGGDVSIVPQDNATTLDRVQDRRRSTARGCPSRGRRAGQRGRRQGPRRRGDAVAGGQVRHHATSSCATKFLEDHPDVVQQLVKGLVGSIDLIKTTRPRRRQLVVRRHREGHGQADRGRRRHRRRSSTSVHARPDRVVAEEGRRGREGARLLDSSDRRGHLRPRRCSTSSDRQGRANRSRRETALTTSDLRQRLEFGEPHRTRGGGASGRLHRRRLQGRSAPGASASSRSTA